METTTDVLRKSINLENTTLFVVKRCIEKEERDVIERLILDRCRQARGV